MGIQKFKNVLSTLLICFVCVFVFAFSAQSVFADDLKDVNNKVLDEKKLIGKVGDLPIADAGDSSGDDEAKDWHYNTVSPFLQNADTGSANISGGGDGSGGAGGGSEAFAELDEPVARSSGTDLSTEQPVKNLENSLKAAWDKFSPIAADAVFEEGSDQLKPWARTAGLIIIILIAVGIISSVYRRSKHRSKARK